MKKLCSADGCFHYVDTRDFVMRTDGTIHLFSTLCFDCITVSQSKALKNFKKRQRHTANRRMIITEPNL